MPEASPRLVPFPLPESRLPGLEPLLGGGLWGRWVREGRVFPVDDIRLAVSYVRLKPGDSCRLVVRGSGPRAVDGVDGPPQAMLVHLFATDERARTAFSKECSRVHLTPGAWNFRPFLSEEHAAVVVPFPNDADLPALRHLYMPERFRRSLAELLPAYPTSQWRFKRREARLNLLAYKPGRRATFHIKVRAKRRSDGERRKLQMHLKVEHPKTAARSYRNASAIYEAISQAGYLWRVPAPVGFIESRSLVATEWVQGQPLEALVAGCEIHLEMLRRIGAALAELHATPLDLPPARSNLEDAAGPVVMSADLVQLLPEEKTRILALGERLSAAAVRLAEAPPATVHGDFHLGQVLFEDGNPVLVDLDRAGRGAAAGDLGHFLAHLLELGQRPELGEAFVDGYRAVNPGLHPDSIRVATAAALYRRAIFPFRNLEQDWPEGIRRHLDHVTRLLDDVTA